MSALGNAARDLWSEFTGRPVLVPDISENDAEALADHVALRDIQRVNAELLAASEPTNGRALLKEWRGEAIAEADRFYDWQRLADIGLTDPTLARHLISFLQVAEHHIRGDIPDDSLASSARTIGTIVAARLAVKIR
jgi:hypothetical protein